MRCANLLALAAMFGLSAHVSAQPSVITLDQASQIALERNINVVQSENNAASAQSGVLAAYGNYLPSLSASGYWTRRQSEGPLYVNGQPIPGVSSTTTNQFNAGVSANLTLFNGFIRESGVSKASADASSAEQDAARTKQAIVYQTQANYLNVLRDEQLVAVSRENLKRDQRQLERIVESNRVGALSVADVYRQQSAVSADEFDLINAQNAFDKAKADLAALVGLDAGAEYVFADSTIPSDIDTAEINATMAKYADISSLMKRALDARPDYLSAQEMLRSADAGVTVAKGGYYPAIGISAGYSYFNDRLADLTKYNTISWGLGLQWDLFDGFQTNQRVQGALAQQRNAEINLAQTERTVTVDVKKALLDLDAARQQCRSAQRGLVSATEDRKIAEERYNLGAGTLLDLLTANAALVQAQANKVNASYNYTTAKRNLEYALGERTY